MNLLETMTKDGRPIRVRHEINTDMTHETDDEPTWNVYASIGGKTVLTYKDPTDKYGRWIADVYVNGKSVSATMVEAGHAVRVDY